MEKLNKFRNNRIKTSAMYKVVGGRYQKTGCGTVDYGGATITYKCDVIDDEGKKAPMYFGTVIRPH